jgi:hypothetical protein
VYSEESFLNVGWRRSLKVAEPMDFLKEVIYRKIPKILDEIALSEGWFSLSKGVWILEFSWQIFGDLKQNPTFLKLNLTFEKQTLKEFF